MTKEWRHRPPNPYKNPGPGTAGRAWKGFGLCGLCAMAVFASPSHAAVTCERTVTANVVAFDKPIMYNRLGAGNINGQMFALKRDVVDANGVPLTLPTAVATPGTLDLRGDKRQRPLVLHIRKGDCLQVNLSNLLTQAASPRQLPNLNPPPPQTIVSAAGQQFGVQLDEQVAERRVGFHVSGLNLANSIADDASNVGRNASSLTAAVGGTATYTLYGAKEGVFVISNPAQTFGSDGLEGSTSNGLFGQVIVEAAGPAGARGTEIYRGQVFEEELRLATTGTTADGHPIIDYDALYPQQEPWTSEGKAGLPVLNTICNAAAAATGSCVLDEIVHSEINDVVAYRDPATGKLGKFPAGTYPLESVGKRNPTVPNRLEPYRSIASIYHDETVNGQAFPQWYKPSPNAQGAIKPSSVVFTYVLAGVKDAFMINYGSGGIGSEIIANRLGVGPMHDCLDCSYEEFFLTSFAVGDPAMTVDIPANLGLETCAPEDIGTAACAAVGPKATYAVGAEDPANIHHSYTGDFFKFRNTHNGKEQHVFHLHNHQWLYNPNDDNSNYLDAQGIGPGVGYTYEINFGGSGNRNKSTGDSIFHCHFYPHFAQGMWYHWRHNDVMQTGTVLQGTQQGTVNIPGKGQFHSVPWALAKAIPAKVDAACVDGAANGFPGGVCPRVRAYPDGEIATGTPIPAVVPLPGKPMAPMPGGDVQVVAKVAANGKVVGSNSKVARDGKHPGFPFFVAGMEEVNGQRPPTPPLDMITRAQVQALVTSGNPLWNELVPAQADGWDGGLPRHALQGYADGGLSQAVTTPIDFSKEIHEAKAVFYPEQGTDLEQQAMAYHALRCHDSFLPDGSTAACSGVTTTLNGQSGTVTSGANVASGGFITNGGKPRIGAVYHNPCMDDQGRNLTPGVIGTFFSGDTPEGMTTRGSSAFNDTTPRVIKATNLQFDAVLSKAGYHNPQQRIVALWQDVGPVIAKTKPPEPLVMRNNTFDCTVFTHSNLVPGHYEIDDYQVRTPTDIIGQHIHLPKWDLTTTDGAANGWNYEDGTMSPDVVRERIVAINALNPTGAGNPADSNGRAANTPLVAQPHPYFASVASALDGVRGGINGDGTRTFATAWLGARSTIERWFFDPVVNTDGTDRGLGIIFTHDHYGPSTHQQIGLYSTVLTEPAGSKWVHNESGTQLGCLTAINPTQPAGTTAPNNTACRWDGGPTSWQAAILPQAQRAGNTVGAGTLNPYREFYFEYSDFQHAYEPGIYVGTGQNGQPLPGTGPGLGEKFVNKGNTQFPAGGTASDTFRFAINPPARGQINPVFPDLVLEQLDCVKDAAGNTLLFRPCPQAIDVQDPGVLAVNYRIEPVSLRVFDNNRIGPDGKPGTQAAGKPGDLAFALQSRTDRAYTVPGAGVVSFAADRKVLNRQPPAGANINGTLFPPPINVLAALNPGDPFTPMIRSYMGDQVRVKIQAGGHEEEHNASVMGMKWLQTGSGHGKGPNSGWRNAQAAGISEQFTLDAPVVPSAINIPGASADYYYTMDGGNDGWWSGMWGIFRTYNANRNDLFRLPTTRVPIAVSNPLDFRLGTVCPTNAFVRNYDITAVLANNVLGNSLGVTIPALGNVDPLTGQLFSQETVGGPLNSLGGTLVYNHRAARVGGQTIPPDVPGGEVVVLPEHFGPINDPAAAMYVRTSDLGPDGKLLPGAPVEPLVIRAAAGDCVQITLRNKLPAVMPDLPTYSTLQGVVKRDRFVQPNAAGAVAGATRFDMNLIRASSFVGLTPQLMAFDVNFDGGMIVGANPESTILAGLVGKPVIGPGEVTTYNWYAGDIKPTPQGALLTRLNVTPVEFGGANLLSADRVKQGAKGLVGALSVEPIGANWAEDIAVFDHQTGTGTRATRTQAKVNADSFRSFSLVMQKGVTQYYADGSPVEHINGEAVGIPEDSQEASGMALNYGIEPAWFRFGLVPQAPFGACGGAPGCYGSVADAGDFYSNLLTVPGVGGQQGDPATPVFQAVAGQPARIHLNAPYGTTRGTTFTLHGHSWQRDPYICPGEARNTLVGACLMTTVGSRAIGENPLGFEEGGRESFNAPSHFDVVLRNAGGAGAVAGDYLFRDHASFGNASGLWGILRVQ